MTEVPFARWAVIPPPPGVCQQCAVDHAPTLPHNRDTLHYQYWFRNREARAGRTERWPSWADAMAHCTPEVRDAWTFELALHGVIVPDHEEPRDHQ